MTSSGDDSLGATEIQPLASLLTLVLYKKLYGARAIAEVQTVSCFFTKDGSGKSTGMHFAVRCRPEWSAVVSQSVKTFMSSGT
jgi:hypothetical protein